ncbi:type II secretion system F family protein, partial [Nitrosomonas sp.]|uniref:type II secretion system F family protein n=1 Tax=Nitrosomonas sp. TaxID=42353 RepID=UPI0025E170D6
MRYTVKALLSGKGAVQLELEAASEAEVHSQIHAQGGVVLSVRRDFSGLSGLLSRSRTRFPLANFSQELLALLNAGLNLVEGIETLAEKEEDSSIRELLQQLLARLHEGMTFSRALEAYPQVFPPLYVATVRASERTGDLGEALTRYLIYQSQMDAVRKKLVGASIYPALLLILGGLVAIFLLVFVVPRFSAIYEDVGADLPWMSLLLIEWGHLVQKNGWLLAGATIIMLIALFYLLSQPSVRVWLLQAIWRIPAIGERMRIYQLARFYKT